MKGTSFRRMTMALAAILILSGTTVGVAHDAFAANQTGNGTDSNSGQGVSGNLGNQGNDKCVGNAGRAGNGGYGGYGGCGGSCR